MLTPRPGRVLNIYDVPFDRPRTMEIMSSRDVFDLTNRIRAAGAVVDRALAEVDALILPTAPHLLRNGDVHYEFRPGSDFARNMRVLPTTLPGGGDFLGEIIRWDYIGAGALTASGLYGLLTLLNAPPLLFYGLIAGLGTGAWPHYTILTFLGAMMGRYYFAPRYGQRQWRAYAPVLLAGYGCGLGLIGMTAVSLVLIAKSTSQILF